jgi:hypothetical protein
LLNFKSPDKSYDNAVTCVSASYGCGTKRRDGLEKQRKVSKSDSNVSISSAAIQKTALETALIHKTLYQEREASVKVLETKGKSPHLLRAASYSQQAVSVTWPPVVNGGHGRGLKLAAMWSGGP